MKISIIIPVYNKIRYIATILQQVKDQSFADFECLIIDDGSSDGSGAVCDVFATEDQRFRVFHIPNGGVSHARNVGLDAAQGEYITFIDADDEIHRDYLLNLYSSAEKNQVALVIGNLKKVWQDGRKDEDIPIPYQGKYSINALLPDFASVQKNTGIYGFCVAKLIRKDILQNVRFNTNIALAEDLDFYLEIYPKISEIYFEKEPYYYYLQAAENSSMIGDDSNIDYFTQLCIQRKITIFLENKGYLNNENKKIMTSRLYDYVFFCLFHCDLKKIYSLSADMAALGLPARDKTEQSSFLKRAVLFFFDVRCPVANAFLIWSYRIARNCKRFIQRG